MVTPVLLIKGGEVVTQWRGQPPAAARTKYGIPANHP
jgi:hypothetical protein